jgi:hypothetical protein
MEAELGPRHDAEVAAAPADPPEQLGLLIVGGADDPARGRDQLGGDQVVAGEPILGGEVANAAAEGEAGDAGRADDAPGRDQPVPLGRRVEVEPGGAALADGQAGVGVDIDRPHPREVNHETVVHHTVAGRVVAATAHGDLQRVRPCEVQGGGDVLGVEAARDRGRAGRSIG